MTLNEAKKIIIDNGIYWNNIFDLENKQGKNKKLDKAILKIKLFIYRGIK